MSTHHCGICERPLTLVRPGKYQCDNQDCELHKWFPWWRKPKTLPEWEKLLDQARTSSLLSFETLIRARKTGMPKWLIQRVSKANHRNCRRHSRIKRRIDSMYAALLEELYKC